MPIMCLYSAFIIHNSTIFFISASFSKGQESKFDYLSARYLKKYENLIEKIQQAQ